MIPKTVISRSISFQNGLINSDGARAPERLAIAAHEIRNPAQALIGLSDMLCGMPLSPEAQACARVIKQSAQAIMAVVDDAFDLVRLQQGFIDFVAEPFDPRALVAGTVEILHRQAAAKGLDLAGFSDRDVPARVIGDPARIRQVLLNLAGNAIKFTEEGGVGIALRPASDGALRFIVEDTGPGFADAERAALFSAFNSTAHDQGGLGLGLTISAGIASALGGELSVEARAGGGSRFVFRLPCSVAEGVSEEPQREGKHRPVLIVSPSPFTGPYLEEALRALGHRVERLPEPDTAGLWLARHPGAVMLADAALGEGVVDLAIRQAKQAGCQAIALLRALDEVQTHAPGAAPWPVIRKPVTGRQASLRLDAIGRAAPQTLAEPRPAALIADDCPINRLLACHLLEHEGFRVEAVVDGVEAVDRVAEQLANGAEPFSLILLDLRMPGLDGAVTARQIRGVEALFQAPPSYITGLSALVDDTIAAECRADGMDDVAMKPLSATTLLQLRAASAQKSVIQLSDMCKRNRAAAKGRP